MFWLQFKFTQANNPQLLFLLRIYNKNKGAYSAFIHMEIFNYVIITHLQHQPL